MNPLLEEIAIYIKSRYPIIYLVTSEENRAENLIQKAGEATQKPCFFWSLTSGFYNTKKRTYYAPVNSKQVGKEVDLSSTTPYTAMPLNLNPLEAAFV